MKVHALALIGLCILWMGCFDISEEIILHKNGSGKYSMKIDMSGLIKDPMMKGMLEGDKEGALKDADSVIYFRDLPDSVIRDNPDLWKRAYMRIVTNAEKELFYTSVHLDFKSVDEISYLSENLDKVMGSTKTNSSLSGGLMDEGASSGFMVKGLKYTFSGKELVRESAKNSMKEEDAGNMEIFKSFMAEADYQINYTLPGKVTVVTMPNHTIDGKVVRVKASMMDLMENKVNLNGSIRFR